MAGVPMVCTAIMTKANAIIVVCGAMVAPPESTHWIERSTRSQDVPSSSGTQ